MATEALHELEKDVSGGLNLNVDNIAQIVSDRLGLKPREAESRYKTYASEFALGDGTSFSLRMSNHPATLETYHRSGGNADFNISVITNPRTPDLTIRGKAKDVNVSQFAYTNETLSSKTDVELLLKSIQGLIKDGRFVDLTGKAITDFRNTDDIVSVAPSGAKTPIQRAAKFGVGKQVGSRIYFHKAYADQVVPSWILERAIPAAEEWGVPFNCMMYDRNTGEIRFDEGPDFDTAREPQTGRTLSVSLDGNVRPSNGSEAQEGQIWHHKWLWVGDDYTGFDVEAAKEWSRTWLAANAGKGAPSGYMAKWNAKLDELGLPHDMEGVSGMTPASGGNTAMFASVESSTMAGIDEALAPDFHLVPALVEQEIGVLPVEEREERRLRRRAARRVDPRA